MKPRELLGSGVAPDGNTLTLHREAAGFVVRIGNEVLMSSRSHGSEQEMAAVSLPPALRSTRPRVLVGGLGMGFTLRAALDVLPPKAEVVVAELFPCVVEWNRGPLASLSHDALSDPRVRLVVGDVLDVARSRGSGFDAILLDVDNGPEALVTLGNREIYAPRGVATLAAALRPGGVLAVWSAAGSKAFERTMARAGLRVLVERLAARHDSTKGGRHYLFLGTTRPEGASPGGRGARPPQKTRGIAKPPRPSWR